MRRGDHREVVALVLTSIVYVGKDSKFAEEKKEVVVVAGEGRSTTLTQLSHGLYWRYSLPTMMGVLLVKHECNWWPLDDGRSLVCRFIQLLRCVYVASVNQ